MQTPRRTPTTAEHPRGAALLTTEQLAAYLAVSPDDVKKMRAESTGPDYVQLTARRIRYSPVAVARWLEAKTVRTGGQA